MRNNRASTAAWLSVLGILLLLLFQRQAADGARQGLLLCAAVLIPSLFPISVLSQCLLRSLDPGGLERFAEPWMKRIFRLSGRCALPLLLGLLGGFPLGPQLTALQLQNGSLSRQEAEELSAFCNNAGPGFLIGAVGAGVLGSPVYGILLYLIQILSVLLTARLLRKQSVSETGKTQPFRAPAGFSAGMTSAIADSAAAMLRLAGAVVFFRAAAACLEGSLPLSVLPEQWRAGLSGLLELSGGIARLKGADPLPSFVLSAFLCNWGGFCVHMQAAEAFGRVGISLKRYLTAKLIQAILATLLAWCVSAWIWEKNPTALLFCTGLIGTRIFLDFFKKSNWHSTKTVL